MSVLEDGPHTVGCLEDPELSSYVSNVVQQFLRQTLQGLVKLSKQRRNECARHMEDLVEWGPSIKLRLDTESQFYMERAHERINHWERECVEVGQEEAGLHPLPLFMSFYLSPASIPKCSTSYRAP